jgi:hypothetical protein
VQSLPPEDATTSSRLPSLFASLPVKAAQATGRSIVSQYSLPSARAHAAPKQPLQPTPEPHPTPPTCRRPRASSPVDRRATPVDRMVTDTPGLVRKGDALVTWVTVSCPERGASSSA